MKFWRNTISYGVSINLINTQMNLTQLEQTSDYINKTYDLDTWVNQQTKSIWICVWSKELTDTYDIEMSQEQIKQFYNEINK